MATKKRGRTKPGGARKRKRSTASPGAAVRQTVEGIRKALGPQIGDAYGIALAVMAVLTALGIWFHNAGPIGEFLELAFRGLLGAGGFLTPAIFAYLAYTMFTVRPGPDRPRIVIGLAITLVGALGLLHLAKGTPDVTNGAPALRSAGGVVGAITSGPLHRLLGPWGATFTLLAVLVLGAMILTKTPARRIFEALGERIAACESSAKPP